MNTVTAFAVSSDLATVTVKLRATPFPGVEAKDITILDHRSVFEIVRRLATWRGQARLV
jgi:hypothetical protein